MKADGPRLDGAATSDGGGQGRAGASFVPKEGGGRAKKYKPRHPGPRGSGELGEDHHNQQFYLAG